MIFWKKKRPQLQPRKYVVFLRSAAFNGEDKETQVVEACDVWIEEDNLNFWIWVDGRTQTVAMFPCRNVLSVVPPVSPE